KGARLHAHRRQGSSLTLGMSAQAWFGSLNRVPRVGGRRARGRRRGAAAKPPWGDRVRLPPPPPMPSDRRLPVLPAPPYLPLGAAALVGALAACLVLGLVVGVACGAI